MAGKKKTALFAAIMALFEGAKVTDAATLAHMNDEKPKLRSGSGDGDDEQSRSIEEASQYFASSNSSLILPPNNTMYFTPNVTSQNQLTFDQHATQNSTTIDPKMVKTEVEGNVDPDTLFEIQTAALNQFQNIIDNPDHISCAIRVLPKEDGSAINGRLLSTMREITIRGRSYTITDKKKDIVHVKQVKHKEAKKKPRGLRGATYTDNDSENASDKIEEVKVVKSSAIIADQASAALGYITEINNPATGNATTMINLWENDRGRTTVQTFNIDGVDYETTITISPDGIKARAEKAHHHVMESKLNSTANLDALQQRNTSIPEQYKPGRRLAIPTTADGKVILTYTFAFTNLAAADQGYPANSNALISLAENTLDTLRNAHRLAGIAGYEYRAKIVVGESISVNNAFNAQSWAMQLSTADLDTDYVIGIFSGRQNNMGGIAGAAWSNCGPYLQIEYGKVVGINNKQQCSVGAYGDVMTILHELGHLDRAGHYDGQQRSDSPSLTNYSFAARYGGVNYQATIMDWYASKPYYSSASYTNRQADTYGFGGPTRDNARAIKLHLPSIYEWRRDFSTERPTTRGQPTPEPTRPPTYAVAMQLSAGKPVEFTVNNFNSQTSKLICGDPSASHSEILFGNGGVHVKRYFSNFEQTDVGISYATMDQKLVDNDVMGQEKLSFQFVKNADHIQVKVKYNNVYLNLCTLFPQAFSISLNSDMAFGTDSNNIKLGVGGTQRPTVATKQPSKMPSTAKPIIPASYKPSKRPTIRPSKQPTSKLTASTKTPTKLLTAAPTYDKTPVLRNSQWFAINYDSVKNTDPSKTFSIDLGANRIIITKANNVISATVYRIGTNKKLTLLTQDTDYILDPKALAALSKLTTGETIFRVLKSGTNVILDADLLLTINGKIKTTVTPIVTILKQPLSPMQVNFNNPKIANAILVTAVTPITIAPTATPTRQPSKRPSKRGGRVLSGPEESRETIQEIKFDIIELAKYLESYQQTKKPELEGQLQALTRSPENMQQLISIISDFGHKHNPTTHSEEEVISNFMHLMVPRLLQRVPNDQRDNFCKELVDLLQKDIKPEHHAGITQVYEMFLEVSRSLPAPDQHHASRRL